MYTNKHDSTVRFLIAFLILIFSLLHYFIPPYTILITSFLSLIFSLIIIYFYGDLFIMEYRISSFKIFYVFLFLCIVLEEGIQRIKWKNENFFRESIISEVLNSLNGITRFDYEDSSDSTIMQENIFKLNAIENTNDELGLSLKISNRTGVQDTLLTYTGKKERRRYSESIVLTTAIMIIMAYIIAKPILLGIVFVRYPFQFFKQQNRIQTLFLEKSYVDILFFCLFILLDALISTILWNTVAEGQSHMLCCRWIDQLSTATLLNICMDISGGILTPIAIRIISDFYIFFRIVIFNGYLSQ